MEKDGFLDKPSVCLSMTFQVGQSNFTFCQLSELVRAFYCMFAVMWFWWCVKFRLRAGSKDPLWQRWRKVCTADCTRGAQSTDPMSFKASGQSKEINAHKMCIFVYLQRCKLHKAEKETSVQQSKGAVNYKLMLHKQRYKRQVIFDQVLTKLTHSNKCWRGTFPVFFGQLLAFFLPLFEK